MSKSRWLYNARDCLATYGVYDAIRGNLNERTQRIYEAEMGLQGVCLGVQMRGIRVDMAARDKLIKELTDDVITKGREAEELASCPLVGPKGTISPQKLGKFIYDELEIAEQRKEGKRTTDEDALKRIVNGTIAVRPKVGEDNGVNRNVANAERSRRKTCAAEVAGLVLASRDVAKQRGTISAPTENGRHRTTLNVGGTESFRLSAHKAHTGAGINGQNIDKRLRVIYIPDPGYIMGQMDQDRAESLCVAYAAADQGYIDAHLEGNTHVTVCQLLWPEVKWSKDLAENEAICKKPFEAVKRRDATRYDVAKHIQHGLNYLMTPPGLARYVSMPEAESEQVYWRYFNAFPGIRRWHESVITEIKETGKLIYPGDYERTFFGRRNDRQTWKEAISSIPQSIIAWNNHIVFKRLYYELDGPEFQVLNHIHDAVLFQFRETRRDCFVGPVTELDLMERTKVIWPMAGGDMVVPWSIKYGSNWKAVS